MRAETRAALAAVDAGLKLMRRRAGADQITSKGGRDLVTATDVAVEDAVRASLLSAYPEWTVVGEERGGEDHHLAEAVELARGEQHPADPGVHRQLRKLGPGA